MLYVYKEWGGGEDEPRPPHSSYAAKWLGACAKRYSMRTGKKKILKETEGKNSMKVILKMSCNQKEKNGDTCTKYL